MYGKNACHLQWCQVLELYFLRANTPVQRALAHRDRTDEDGACCRYWAGEAELLAAAHDVEGSMAEAEKEFIDLRALDGEEKTFMDVEPEAENIFQDEVE